MRVISRVIQGVVLAALVLGPVGATAQTLAVADAKAFMGNWAASFEGPMGVLAMDLTVSDAGGKVVAQIGGGELPMSKVTDVTKKGDNLVLKYSVDIQGMTLPVTVTIVAAGDKCTLTFDIADGQFSMPGTATRKS